MPLAIGWFVADHHHVHLVPDLQTGQSKGGRVRLGAGGIGDSQRALQEIPDLLRPGRRW